MCHLLCDSSTEVQKMAYQHLREAAKKRTEYLVIETGVDTEDNIQAELPIQLIDILQRYFNQDEQNDNVRILRQLNGNYILTYQKNLLGYLLGWMLVFDLFTDAVRTLLAVYVRALKLVIVSESQIWLRFTPSKSRYHHITFHPNYFQSLEHIRWRQKGFQA